MIKKQITQFSEKIVVAVVFSEIALCIGTIVLSCSGFDMTIGVDVIKANIPFAMVVFAAYSGNSAVEKWAVRKASTSGATSTDENASNG